jgi:exonuclease III
MLMDLTPLSKGTILTNWIKKEDPTICCLQETHVIDRNKHRPRMKAWKMIYQASGPPKQAGVEILYHGQSRLQTCLDQMR